MMNATPRLVARVALACTMSVVAATPALGQRAADTDTTSAAAATPDVPTTPTSDAPGADAQSADAQRADAQGADAQGADAQLAGLDVYLLTIGQGDQVWERFGHNAILLRDTTRGIDVAYNYGMFSFDQPGFVGRLIQGRMLYWMQPMDGSQMVLAYRSRNRTVRAQKLAFTPAQKYELAGFLEWNARPENRDYLYDPFRDNCSTRVRDALDRVLGGALGAALRNAPTDDTYRSHSLRLLDSTPAAYTGLLIALGQPTDVPLSKWDAAFIPMELSDDVAQLEITNADGTTSPLVSADEIWFQADREPERDVAPSRLFVFVLFGLALAVAFLGLGHIAGHSRAARITLALLAFVWTISTGILGSIIGGMWAFTDHFATYNNENLFVLNPLLLVLSLLVLPAFLARRATRAATITAAVIATLAIAGVVLQILPGLDQQNGEMLAATVPAHVALAIVLWLWNKHVIVR